MSNIAILVWAVVVGVAFAVAWRKGYLVKLSTYIQQTREELKKCTWPSWDELKGSTLVVFLSIVILGGFTMFVDFIFALLVNLIS